MSKETKKAVETKEQSTLLPSAGNQFTQADIPSMLEKVTQRIASLKKGIPETPQTTGELGDFGKIKDIKSVETLLKAYSSVTNRKKAYDEAADAILPAGVKKPPFKLFGSTSAQWEADIKKRIVEVGFEVELKKLNQVKTKLEANLSAEAKLAKDLNDIAGILTE